MVLSKSSSLKLFPRLVVEFTLTGIGKALLLFTGATFVAKNSAQVSLKSNSSLLSIRNGRIKDMLNVECLNKNQ